MPQLFIMCWMHAYKIQRALQDAQKLLLQSEQLCLQYLNTIHDLLLTRTGAQDMLNLS